MTATLKTDVVQDTSGSTANLTLATSGAVTVGGALTVTSGTINGTTIGASTATTGAFTTITGTNLQATSGQTLSLKEDSGTAVITIDTSGDVVVNPATSSGTVTVGSAATQSVVVDAKIAGTGYQSGATSSGVGLGVGDCFVGMTGEIRMWAPTTEPEGWVFCDGSAYDGTAGGAYKNLYDAIGTTYGTGGGGSNMFNVPDLRGRVAAGMDDMNGSAGTGGGNAGRLTTTPTSYGSVSHSAGALGAAGGAETETIGQANLPTHTHNVDAEHGHGDNFDISPSNHNHNNGSFNQLLKITGNATLATGNVSPGEPELISSGTIQSQTLEITGGVSNSTTLSNLTTTNGGFANNAMNNLQPYLCVNYIIKL